MRISEIIRKAGLKVGLPEEKKEPHPTPLPEEVSPPEEKIATLITKKEPRMTVPSKEEGVPAEQIYSEAINCIRKILEALEQNAPIIDFNQAEEVIKKITSKILSGDSQIIFFTLKSTPDNYLYAHSVNVCILSLKLAAGLGWSADKLFLLGMAGFLHDVGMVHLLQLVSKPGKLTPQEYEEVKKHPLYGKEILEKLDNKLEKNLKDLLALIAYQQHERIDGQGYPQGLKDKNLHEFAKIIGLVDVYEGLTHPRSYRERMLAHEALRYLIETSEGKFEATLLKIFIEELSLYPLGSFVRLNTEEVGEVVKSNRKFPTRPVLRLILGSHGEKLAPVKFIDLTETPILYIREPIDETKLKINDKELTLKLKVRRWWISGSERG